MYRLYSDMTMIKDQSELSKINPVTGAVIFMTKCVDIGNLTEKNVKEFWERSRIYNLMTDTRPVPYVEDGQTKTRAITLEELETHIGLATNVPTRSRESWLKKMTACMVKNAEYAYGLAKRDLEAKKTTAA